MEVKPAKGARESKVMPQRHFSRGLGQSRRPTTTPEASGDQSLRHFFEAACVPAWVIDYPPLVIRDCRLTVGQLSKFLGREPLLPDLNHEVVAGFLEWYPNAKNGRRQKQTRSNQERLLMLWRYIASAVAAVEAPGTGMPPKPFEVSGAIPPRSLPGFFETVYRPELVARARCRRAKGEEHGDKSLLAYGRRRVAVCRAALRMYAQFLRRSLGEDYHPTVDDLSEQNLRDFTEFCLRNGNRDSKVRTFRHVLLHIWRQADHKLLAVPNPPHHRRGKFPERLASTSVRSLCRFVETACRAAWLLDPDRYIFREALRVALELGDYLGRDAVFQDLNRTTVRRFLEWYGRAEAARAAQSIARRKKYLFRLWRFAASVEPSIQAPPKDHGPDRRESLGPLPNDSLAFFFVTVFQPDQLANARKDCLLAYWSAIRAFGRFVGAHPLLGDLTTERLRLFAEDYSKKHPSHHSVKHVCGPLLAVAHFAAMKCRPETEWSGLTPQRYLPEMPDLRLIGQARRSSFDRRYGTAQQQEPEAWAAPGGDPEPGRGGKSRGGRKSSPARPLIKALWTENPKMNRGTMARRINQELGKKLVTAASVRGLIARMKREKLLPG